MGVPPHGLTAVEPRRGSVRPPRFHICSSRTLRVPKTAPKLYLKQTFTIVFQGAWRAVPTSIWKACYMPRIRTGAIPRGRASAPAERSVSTTLLLVSTSRARAHTHTRAHAAFGNQSPSGTCQRPVLTRYLPTLEVQGEESSRKGRVSSACLLIP